MTGLKIAHSPQHISEKEFFSEAQVNLRAQVLISLAGFAMKISDCGLVNGMQLPGFTVGSLQYRGKRERVPFIHRAPAEVPTVCCPQDCNILVPTRQGRYRVGRDGGGGLTVTAV